VSEPRNAYAAFVTDGRDLANVKSVALDTSSRTSVVLTKIIFREFLGFEPQWRDAAPNITSMLAESDAALLIGDPALALSESSASANGLRTFDLAELWNQHTGLGFVFAMWMTRRDRVDIDLAAARDEGLSHLGEIAANYCGEIGLSSNALIQYLSQNISYLIDERMAAGLDLYLDLAATHGMIEKRVPFNYLEVNSREG
jgi:chorismate dehydratase